ncbi:hypothetical protein COCON_G00018500 [Conger conger]|uniref:C2 domain-containing protein n=1 Tax=Conger conger TaxID=82655 RepID=A0A9Q1E3X5_CONCO|nr:hypothetical protein COCON_G00018500 [Conger conger]
MRRTPLDELQPPPYQDEDGSPRMSCTPSDLGDAKCELSRCSDSPATPTGSAPAKPAPARRPRATSPRATRRTRPATAPLRPAASNGTSTRGQVGVGLRRQPLPFLHGNNVIDVAGGRNAPRRRTPLILRRSFRTKTPPRDRGIRTTAVEFAVSRRRTFRSHSRSRDPRSHAVDGTRAESHGAPSTMGETMATTQRTDMSARGSAGQLPKGYEPEPAAKYGTLDVAFDYDSDEQRLMVHLVLLPTKKQRAKTGMQKGPCPVFTETFRFSHIESEMIGNYAVRFRLYSVRRMKKEKALGEKVFYLTKLNLQGKMSMPVTLEPCCALPQGCESQVSISEVSCSESASSCQSAGQGSTPEILVGLVYNATTGRLSVEVIRGSHFKNLAANKPPRAWHVYVLVFAVVVIECAIVGVFFRERPHLTQSATSEDTYVKLTLLNSMGQEMSKCKTSICRGQPNPTYKETFVFQVALFQLSDVTLILSVYNKRSMKRKEMIGWISLGLNSSGEEELSHWTQMKESKGQQVCRWHSLLET